VPGRREDANRAHAGDGLDPLRQPLKLRIEIAELRGVIISTCTLDKKEQPARPPVRHFLPYHDVQPLILDVLGVRVIRQIMFG